MAEALTKDPLPRRLVRFYHEVVAEVKKVTWPDKGQVRSLSIGVVILSLFVGALIGLMDVGLQAVLVRGIPSLLGRG